MNSNLLVGCLENSKVFDKFRVENNYILQEYNYETCMIYKVNSRGELVDTTTENHFKLYDLRTNTIYSCEKKGNYYRHVVISVDVNEIHGRDVMVDNYRITSAGLELKYKQEDVQIIGPREGFIMIMIGNEYCLFKLKDSDQLWTKVITADRFICRDLSTPKKLTYLIDGKFVQILDIINPLKQSMILKFVEGKMDITNSYSNFLNSAVRIHMIHLTSDNQTLIPQPSQGAKLEYTYNVDCNYDGQWKVSLNTDSQGTINFQTMDKGKLINESYYISKKNNTIEEVYEPEKIKLLTHTITDNSYFVYDGKQHRLYVQDSSNISEGQKISLFNDTTDFVLTVQEKKDNILIVSGEGLPQQNLFSLQSFDVMSWVEQKINSLQTSSIESSFQNVNLKGNYTTSQYCSDIVSSCSQSNIINSQNGLSMGQNNFISSKGHLISGNFTTSLGNDLITLGNKIMNFGQNNIVKGDDINLSGYQATYEYNGQTMNLLDINETVYSILGRFGKIIIEHQGLYHQLEVRMPLPGTIMTSEGNSSIYNIFIETKLDNITQAKGAAWIGNNDCNLIQGNSIKTTGLSNLIHGTGHSVDSKNSLISGSNNRLTGRYFFKAVQKKEIFSTHYQEFKEPFELQVGDSLTMVPNVANPEIMRCKVLSVNISNNFLTFTVDQPTISNVYYFIEVFQPSCVIIGEDNVSINGNMTVGDHNINRSENCLLVGSQNQSFGKLYNVDYCNIDSKYVVNTLITESEGKLLAVYHSHISEVDYKDGVMKEDGFHFKIEGDRPSQCAFINQHGKGGAVIGNKNLIADQGLVVGEDNRCLSSSLVVGDHNTSSYQNSICVGQSIKDLADGSLNIGSESRQINFISASIINNKVFFGQHKTINLNKNIMYRLSLKIMIMNEDEVHFLDYDRFTAFFNEVSKLSDKELFFPTLDAKLIVDYCEESLGFHIEDEKQWNGMMNLQIDSLKC